MKSLKLEGDWRARLAEPRIKLRARSIEQIGVIHEPLVRWADKRPIAGRDRIAALVKLGHDRITVKAIDCTDEEAQAIAAAENSERRHLTPKELQAEAAKTVDSLARSIAESTGKKARGGGRGGSAKAQAEAEVAAALGVKPKTLAKQRERASKREGQPPPAEPEAPAVAPPPPIQTFGIELDQAWLDGIKEHQLSLDGMLAAMANVSRHLTALEGAEVPKHPARLQEMRRMVTQLRAFIAGSKPTHLCPWCKGQQSALSGCSACTDGTAGTAIVLAHQMGSCPAELLETDPLVYYDHGSLATIIPADAADDWGIE